MLCSCRSGRLVWEIMRREESCLMSWHAGYQFLWEA